MTFCEGKNTSRNTDEVVVSVALKTYNTKDYVSDAIESILAQQTCFHFELVISDDASIDGTSEIVQDYADKYPTIIKAFIAEKNRGLQKNDAFIENQCLGKYIAICDDDDYWTDPYKLQKQVDFLEKNTDYVLVSHAITILNINTKTRELSKTVNLDQWDISQKDFLLSMPVPNLAVMYRNHLIKEYPEHFYRGIAEDRKKYMLLTEYGKGKFINDVVGFQRLRENSITGNYRDDLISSKISNIEYEIELVSYWNGYLNKKYDKEAYAYIEVRKQRLFTLYLLNREYKKAMVLSQSIDLSLVKSLKRKYVLMLIVGINKIQKKFS